MGHGMSESVRSEVLRAVTMNTIIFLNVTPYSVVGLEIFRRSVLFPSSESENKLGVESLYGYTETNGQVSCLEPIVRGRRRVK
jgi:hypothetical protein